MDKLFFKMPCLSKSNEIRCQDIYERLFDKRVDKRYLESAVQKFLLLNQKMFSFIGLALEMHGTGRDLSIKFETSRYIGAIPVKMPYDGIAHKDFQIIPRFDVSDNVFSDLTQMLSRLEYAISPEYSGSDELSLPLQLRPPMYYEAAKFIELFEKAQKQHWVKFEVVKKNHSFPKTNTDWSKYAEYSSNPVKALVFPSSDSILSMNHREWQEFIYVFNIAKSIILQQNVPESISCKYRNKIISLGSKNSMIKALKTDVIPVHASDPPAIKNAKCQANTLLQKGNTSCLSWRIDMAKLFECYVQYIVTKSMKGIDGDVIPNSKIHGRGQIPPWGLKYLEPDMIIKYKSTTYMADAKYKAHYYAYGQQSESLKESHRSDLHQLLAYSSFSPDKNKIGVLFYPSKKLSCKKINYLEQLGGINNTVYLFGIPFGINGIEPSVYAIRKFFNSIVLESAS